jgi:hypothetical protein
VSIINCKLNVDIEHIKFNNSDDIRIRIIAKIYEISYSNHFLGHMGRKFLELFISEFVNSTSNYGYVAKYMNEPIGFILASTSDTPFNNLYRKNFLSVVLIAVSRSFYSEAYQ